MLRGKEKKKRKKNMQSQIEVDKEDLYTLKINCKGKEQQEMQMKELM